MALADEKDPKVTLEQFAGIVAALEAGEARDQVLARAGLSVEAWTAARDGWLERLARRASVGDLSLCRQYTELCKSQSAAAKQRMRTAPKALSGNVPLAPVARLVRLVSGAVGLLRDGARPATPFQPGPSPAAPRSISTPTPPPPPPAGARSLSDTAPAVSSRLLAPALPFRRAPAPEPAPAARTQLAGTRAFDLSQPLKSATPFTKAAEVVARPPAPPRAVASVTLADYAKLCATVRMFPGQVPDIMAQYGFDASSWRELHTLWRERLDKDASLKARWEMLVERHVTGKTL